MSGLGDGRPGGRLHERRQGRRQKLRTTMINPGNEPVGTRVEDGITTSTPNEREKEDVTEEGEGG